MSAVFLEHRYGERVAILDHPWISSALFRISQSETSHLELMSLLRSAYVGLAQIAFGMHLPSVVQRGATRMAETHGERGFWTGRILDPSAKVVVLDVIRGGIVPAQTCFELLTAVLPLDHLRLDHVNMARIAGPDGHVMGVDLSGSKIGGSLDGVTLLVPDPMGATGSTLVRALEYLSEHHGRPQKVVAMPLITTPEFLRTTLGAHPNLHVVAGRLDRGMSSKEVLASVPGTAWEAEKGLDEHDYIVPGAGGVGELLNNSWC